MTNTDQPAPDLVHGVRDVPELAFGLLGRLPGVDLLLDTLRAAAGQRDTELDSAPTEAWAAANRFVLDAFIEGQAAMLPEQDVDL